MKYCVYVVFLLSFQLFAQQSDPKESFLEKWYHSEAYLMEIIDLIPEDSLHYKPTERQMSFEEQLLHIQRNMDWLGTVYFTEASNYQPSDNTDKGMVPIYSKNDLKRRLKNAFETLAERVRKTPEKELSLTVEFFAGPKSKWQILNLLQDHVTHHRGQLIVYLNLLNVEPPKYIGW